MIQGETYTVYIGNNLDILPTLQDCSVDSIVTDPPYELGFMGKKWDSTGIAYNADLWRECLRVLKPGGHLLSFGGTRTWHRVAVAIEDAGFEVRDSIAWMYGSGFPKSLDVSKAIEGKITTGSSNKKDFKNLNGEQVERGDWGIAKQQFVHGQRDTNYDETAGETRLGKLEATTPEAKQWEGWGTALKPAFEPIVVARKPLIGTVAENVLTYGTGGLNIDASRIGTTVETWPSSRNYSAKAMSRPGSTESEDAETQSTGPVPAGRWPANVILDEYSVELLDEQSGLEVRGNAGSKQVTEFRFMNDSKEKQKLIQGVTDKGGASRFFYVAKASKRDRNEGLEELDPQRHADRQKDDGVGGDNPRNRTNQARQNFHPTVKPTDLMRYLIKLVTPPNGTVLDPFTGSGSTGKAAILEGFRFIGIEMTEDYIPIIEGRLKHAEDQRSEGLF
jgi:site-specific DNA-methyltransferase (adenine-specific)